MSQDTKGFISEYPIIPQDVPPSYDTAVAGPSSGSGLSSPPTLDEKFSEKQSPLSIDSGPRLTFPEPPKSPLAATFQASFYRKQTHTAVLSYVRDLVKRGSDVSWDRALSVLSQCKSACHNRGLVFSDVLQENALDGHSALYWVVIQHPSSMFPGIAYSDSLDILSLLLQFAIPIKPQTFEDMRHACLLNDDQALFRRLWTSRAVQAFKDARASIVSGHAWSKDDVTVEFNEEDEKAFAVDFTLDSFHQRMVVLKRIEVDFIAKSRLWRLSFFAEDKSRPGCWEANEGEWCFSVSLLDTSLPTPLDSQLIFFGPSLPVPDLDPVALPLPQSPSESVEQLPTPSTALPKPESESKKPATLRLKRTNDLVSIANGHFTTPEAARLRDCLHGESLLTPSCPLYGNEGTLKCRWEARLAAPEAASSDQEGPCVIC